MKIFLCKVLVVFCCLFTSNTSIFSLLLSFFIREKVLSNFALFYPQGRIRTFCVSFMNVYMCVCVWLECVKETLLCACTAATSGAGDWLLVLTLQLGKERLRWSNLLSYLLLENFMFWEAWICFRLLRLVKTCKSKIIVEVYIAKASFFQPGRIVVYMLMYFKFSYNNILIEYNSQDQVLWS